MHNSFAHKFAQIFTAADCDCVGVGGGGGVRCGNKKGQAVTISRAPPDSSVLSDAPSAVFGPRRRYANVTNDKRNKHK